MTIKPPFAAYHRAELERLVQEGFEEIERRAAERPGHWSLISAGDFQLLVAADYYLRSTR